MGSGIQMGGNTASSGGFFSEVEIIQAQGIRKSKERAMRAVYLRMVLAMDWSCKRPEGRAALGKAGSLSIEVPDVILAFIVPARFLYSYRIETVGGHPWRRAFDGLPPCSRTPSRNAGSASHRVLSVPVLAQSPGPPGHSFAPGVP